MKELFYIENLQRSKLKGLLILSVEQVIIQPIDIEKYVFIDTFEIQQSRYINVFNFNRLYNKSVLMRTNNLQPTYIAYIVHGKMYSYVCSSED